MKQPTKRQLQRRAIREALQAIRKLKPRYWYWCERYRALKKEKRVLNRTLRAQFKELTATFLELNAAFKEAGERLQLARDKKGHTGPTKAALEYARGWREGQEQMKRLQEEKTQ